MGGPDSRRCKPTNRSDDLEPHYVAEETPVTCVSLTQNLTAALHKLIAAPKKNVEKEKENRL